MTRVFIAHRWNHIDYQAISALLNQKKYEVKDFASPADGPFGEMEIGFNMDPVVQQHIRNSNVVVCTNRPAYNWAMSIENIRYAVHIGKPVVAIKVTENTSIEIVNLNIPVIPAEQSKLDAWISANAGEVR